MNNNDEKKDENNARKEKIKYDHVDILDIFVFFMYSYLICIVLAFFFVPIIPNDLPKVVRWMILVAIQLSAVLYYAFKVKKNSTYIDRMRKKNDKNDDKEVHDSLK